VRVLIVGDLHCDTAAAIKVIDHAAEVGADVIMQVGDFGFWPRTESGRKFLRKAETRLDRLGLQLWWVDGNHDDLQALRTRPVEADGRRRVSEHIWHLPRGHRWVWGGTAWVAAGGAVSVDRYGRTEGVSWFRDEALTEADVDQIVAGGAADVIVAHDGPWGDGVLGRRLSLDMPVPDRGSWWPEELLLESDAHMRRMRRLVEGVGAGRVFHGHHHVRYDDLLTATHGSVKVTGLGDNEGPIDQAWILVDEAGQPIS
jgi:Calcineurin-like phosphoesterase superfamily domain